MDRRDRDKEHVTLSVAAAITYHQVTGTTEDIVNPADLDKVLNRTAHALALITEIFVLEDGAPRPLSTAELVEGAFARGATLFRSGAGVAHAPLSVPRGALRDAIKLLSAAMLRI
jgi:hypothetical protein